MSYTVAQNTSFLTVASVLQRAISFVYFIVIARIIGVENTGVYFFAITFTTIFTVVADFGLNPVLTREAARYPEKSEEFFSTVFLTKIVFGVVAYGLVVFFINLFNYPTLTKELVYLSGLTMFFDNLHSSFYSLFRARKNLIYESIGIIGSQFLTAIIGTIALLNHWPLLWLILAYTIPSGLNVLYSGWFAHKIYNLKHFWLWRKELFVAFVVFSWPFALAGIISRFYSYSDSLLMSKMLSPQELGWWSVPYKITFAFQFIPVALVASVYPAMSSFYLEEKEKIGELFEKSWRYLLTIVLPLSFGLMVLAYPVITKIYKPEYAPAVPVLQILLISLIFGFLAFTTGALLNATNHQKIQTSLLGVSLVISVVLNLILLPRLGIIGAAVSATISNFVLLLGGFVFSRRYVVISGRNLWKYFNQAFWPAVVMAVVVYLLVQKINFLITIPIGVLVYFILLWLTGGIDRELINNIKAKIKFTKN